MSRLSKTLPCPACQEPMKVSTAKVVQKVCCPHCRQNVVLQPSEDSITPFPSPVVADLTEPLAAAQLSELLAVCQAKQRTMEELRAEILQLEDRARLLGNWLQTQTVPPDAHPITRTMIDVQSRLFEKVLAMEKRHIVLSDCDATSDRSLASFFQTTFEAAGWEVDCQRSDERTRRGEEVTFIVAPGPVSYPVATMFLALQEVGLRVYCEIDCEQSKSMARLCLHHALPKPRLFSEPHELSEMEANPMLEKSA